MLHISQELLNLLEWFCYSCLLFHLIIVTKLCCIWKREGYLSFFNLWFPSLSHFHTFILSLSHFNNVTKLCCIWKIERYLSFFNHGFLHFHTLIFTLGVWRISQNLIFPSLKYAPFGHKRKMYLPQAPKCWISMFSNSPGSSRPQIVEFQPFQIPQVPPHIRTDAAHLWLPGVPPLQDWKARDGRRSQLWWGAHHETYFHRDEMRC